MEANDRITCLEALAAFAWADGTVSELEQARIQEFICGASDISAADISRMIGSMRGLSDDLLGRIKALPAEHACELIAVADTMCHGVRPATAAESGLLRQIAVTRFGEKNWSRIAGWLEHQRQANTLLDDLLDEYVVLS